jgi:hypothetical protein
MIWAITPYWGDRAMAFLIACGVIWGLVMGRRENRDG